MSSRGVVVLSGLTYTDEEAGSVDMTVTGWFDQPIPFHYVPGDTSPLSEVVRDLLAQGAYSVAPAPKKAP